MPCASRALQRKNSIINEPKDGAHRHWPNASHKDARADREALAARSRNRDASGHHSLRKLVIEIKNPSSVDNETSITRGMLRPTRRYYSLGTVEDFRPARHPTISPTESRRRKAAFFTKVNRCAARPLWPLAATERRRRENRPDRSLFLSSQTQISCRYITASAASANQASEQSSTRAKAHRASSLLHLECSADCASAPKDRPSLPAKHFALDGIKPW